MSVCQSVGNSVGQGVGDGIGQRSRQGTARSSTDLPDGAAAIVGAVRAWLAAALTDSAAAVGDGNAGRLAGLVTRVRFAAGDLASNKAIVACRKGDSGQERSSQKLVHCKD